ncbi:uridine kinase [candidate division Kazan bacterium RBG_13_50_9]|uniref:uridine/cytidine kinase n=1 Tax=candidate division Kazan bacterium RBG_13_50_9 TaxID=1798535 RepID=A0A1F4NSX8_UNCK3|nr:MAG: uridine kinase [candidate division Kazan bacterium RBG_13_50_9]
MIAIAGGTGSGKTYVAKKLQEADSKNVIIISHDHYYKDRSDVPLGKRKELNYDEPAALDNALFLEHLKKFKAGQPVDIPQYDFGTHTRRAETRRVEPKPVIIVEGILILTDPAIRALFDLTLFVEVDADIRLARRLARDVGERDRSFQESLNQYLVSAQPMYDRYVEPGKDYADLIINNNGTQEELADALVTLRARIKEVLGKRQ